MHLPRCLHPIAAARACACSWTGTLGWDMGRGSCYQHPTPCVSSFGFDPGANPPAGSKTGSYTPGLWVLPGLPIGMLPALATGSPVGKEHWDEQDRGALLLSRDFCPEVGMNGPGQPASHHSSPSLQLWTTSMHLCAGSNALLSLCILFSGSCLAPGHQRSCLQGPG